MSFSTRLAKDVLANTRAAGWLGRIPFVEAAYGRNALFRTNHTGLFYGVYGSYEEAIAAIPPSRAAGWDNEASATIWTGNIHQLNPCNIQLCSYAVLFWLLRLMRDDTSIVDLGGSIGLTYYRYQRFASLPAKARWSVVEMPKIVAEGRRVAVREAATALQFETAIEAVRDCDILLSAGALQFMEHSVPGLLDRFAKKPAHIILNKVPLIAGEAYWTLQNYGPAITPNRVYNEVEFISYFENAGYAMKDRWNVSELDCYVPFHPERCVREFTASISPIRVDRQNRRLIRRGAAMTAFAANTFLVS